MTADASYDANGVFDRFAERGYQVGAGQVDANPGSGHHYQSPARLRGIALWGTAFGRAVYRCRVGIEGAFGNATSFAGGLGPLPAWVRRLGRVQRWVWCKMAINAARIRLRADQRQRLAAPCNTLARAGASIHRPRTQADRPGEVLPDQDADHHDPGAERGQIRPEAGAQPART